MNTMKFEENDIVLKDVVDEIRLVCREMKQTDDWVFDKGELRILFGEDILEGENYIFSPTDVYLKREEDELFKQMFFSPTFTIRRDMCVGVYVPLEHTIFSEKDSLVAIIHGIRIQKR